MENLTMYAVIEKDTDFVVFASFSPTPSDVGLANDKHYTVELDENNSPAYTPGKYMNGKFYEGYFYNNRMYIKKENA